MIEEILRFFIVLPLAEHDVGTNTKSSRCGVFFRNTRGFSLAAQVGQQFTQPGPFGPGNRCKNRI